MRPIHPARSRLVESGKVTFGTFDGPFEQVNALDVDLGVPIPRLMKSSRLKEWQAFQFGNEEIYVNVALFNAKILAIAQVKVYERKLGKRTIFERKLPPWAFAVPDNVLDSECSYSDRRCRLHFRNLLSEGELRISFDVSAAGSVPEISGELVARTEGHEPLVVSIPFDNRRGMYSHKALAPVYGHVSLARRRVELSESDSYLFMDDHKGFYPFAMKWDWIAAGGHLDDGRLIGINLTRNQSIDADRFNENCVWLDGRRHFLPGVSFDRSREGLWAVRDAQGAVDLRFEIDDDSRSDINLLVVRSRYRGPFGRLSGRLKTDEIDIEIAELFGMGEDFYLRC